jgi:hypothetical protein
MINIWLHAAVMSNRILGEFMQNVHSLAQEAKLRLFDVRWRRGSLYAGQYNAIAFLSYAMSRLTRTLINSSENIPPPSQGLPSF